MSEPISEGLQGCLISPARGGGGPFSRAVRQAGYASPFYRYFLRGRHPGSLVISPASPWPGSGERADAIFRGEYDFAGEKIIEPDCPPWDIATAGEAWQEVLHGFDWLRHFEAAGGEAAGRHARGLVRGWLSRYPDWHPLAWRPHVLASRVISWMRHEKLIINRTDLIYRSQVLNSIARQVRHLGRAWPMAAPGLPRLIATVGLVYGSACLPGNRRRLGRALELLDGELAAQILADGGYVTRNPGDHHAALRLLVGLRDTLVAKGDVAVLPLQGAIDRMTPMLRFFRHGDGALALFNGGFEDHRDRIAATLTASGTRGRQPRQAPASGFTRLSGGKTVILMDTGLPPAEPLSRRSHAGLLSFELSSGRQRIVVNCGSVPPSREGPGWDRVSRSTAAHSTLVVDNRNSSAIQPSGIIGLRPVNVECQTEERDGATWVEASHDGYQRTYGLTHRRRLFLAPNGDDLRGEDSVTGPGGRRSRGLPVDLRFHLHPGITCSIVQDGESVLLRSRRGEGWRFLSRGGSVSIDESVYLGHGGNGRRCTQIIVSTKLAEDDLCINWSFK